jgi:hypothetical protein
VLFFFSDFIENTQTRIALAKLSHKKLLHASTSSSRYTPTPTTMSGSEDFDELSNDVLAADDAGADETEGNNVTLEACEVRPWDVMAPTACHNSVIC